MKTKTTLCSIALSLLMMSFTYYKMGNNGFNLENVAYITSFAYNEHFGPDQSGLSGNIDIHFMSAPKDSMPEEFSLVTLDLNSPDLAHLAEGTYTYEEPTGKIRTPYTFSDAYIILNSESPKRNEFLQSTGGEITVVRKGKKYKIEYSLQLEEGLSLSGSYTGLIEKW